MKSTIKSCLAGALALAATATSASAGSELLPGISTGIPIGAPLPEGVWNVTWFTHGQRGGNGPAVTALAPRFLWSTPWSILGGKLIFDTVTPYVSVRVPGVGVVAHDWGNTLLNAQLKWSLGNGWFAGIESGIYLPNKSAIAVNSASWQGAAAVSYLGDGWNFTNALFVGTGHSSGLVKTPAWMNYDLTATKKFGKFEAGLIAFAATDLNTVGIGGRRQSQVAIGALLGYDFGPLNAQFKLTQEVHAKNYPAKETRGWLQLTIPLWMPKPAEAPKGALVRKG